MTSTRTARGLLSRAPLAAAVAVALLAAPAAQAFEFTKGTLTGSLDTTVSYGYSWRTEDADPNLIGKVQFNPALCYQNIPLGPIAVGPGRCSSNAVPGSAFQNAAPGRYSVNRDDGDLKYGKGDPFSNAFKITSELSLKWGDNNDWGAFTRATYFYDFENANRDDLTRIAKEKVGKDFRLLDAFVYHDFTVGGHKGSWRVGRQAVSWGESTFIQNGINVINPIDVSKLRVAGAELKEAFLPIDMLWASFSFTDNLSMEALYMLEFEEVEVDPSGTYFSSNDFASPGGNYVMLGFGTAPQPVLNPENYFATCKSPLGSGFASSDSGLPPALQGFACANSVPRLPNRNARDSGQYGAAVHWFAENWGNTDFGFYFLNYHSRLPLLSGRTVSTAALTGTPAGLTAGFYVEYPEDIQMYGFSWNTTLPGGVAWQGETSYRPNMPLQVDDVELLFAALSPLNNVVPALISTPALRFCSQLNPGCTASPFSTDQRGWRRHEVSQLQMTFTKAFSSVLGAQQLALVGEIGATEVWDLPDPSVLRYEGEGTDTGGGPDVNAVFGSPLLPSPPYPPGTPSGLFTVTGGARNPLTLNDGFPTKFSWGYRVAARADYNNAFGSPVTLSPRVAFNHDVNGTTPGPGGNFLEGRKSGTLGMEANYLNKLVFDLSYTAFFGGGRFNQISDRDFASFTVKYSF
ncbi:DUF1302 domain-containing protein [soil metagenome]